MNNKSKFILFLIILISLLIPYQVLATDDDENQEIKTEKLEVENKKIGTQEDGNITSNEDKKILKKNDDGTIFYGTEKELKEQEELLKRIQENEKIETKTEEVKKDENLENNNIESEIKLRTKAKVTTFSTETTTELDSGMDGIVSTFSIESDPSAIYRYHATYIEKLSLLTKKTEKICDFEKWALSNYFVQGNIVYVMVNDSSKTNPYHIQGYDVIQKKKVFDKEFAVDDASYRNHDFAVDKNQNFFFKTGKATITSYNKNGQFLDKTTNEADVSMVITGITPNGKVLGIKISTGSILYGTGGYLIINNGKFSRYTGTLQGQHFNNEILYYENNNFYLPLRFNSEGTFAFNDYGNVFSLNYSADANRLYVC